MIPQGDWKFWGSRRGTIILADDAFEKVGWVYGAVWTIGRTVEQVRCYAARSIRGRVVALGDCGSMFSLSLGARCLGFPTMPRGSLKLYGLDQLFCRNSDSA